MPWLSSLFFFSILVCAALPKLQTFLFIFFLNAKIRTVPLLRTIQLASFELVFFFKRSINRVVVRFKNRVPLLLSAGYVRYCTASRWIYIYILRCTKKPASTRSAQRYLDHIRYFACGMRFSLFVWYFIRYCVLSDFYVPTQKEWVFKRPLARSLKGKHDNFMSLSPTVLQRLRDVLAQNTNLQTLIVLLWLCVKITRDWCFLFFFWP